MTKTLVERCKDIHYYQECLHKSPYELKLEIETIANQYHRNYSYVSGPIYIMWADGEITKDIPLLKYSFFHFMNKMFGLRDRMTLFPPLFQQSIFNFPFSQYPFTGCILSLDECQIFRSWIQTLYKNRLIMKE